VRYAATGPDGPVTMLVDEFASESPDLGAVTLELVPVRSTACSRRIRTRIRPAGHILAVCSMLVSALSR